MQGAQLIALQMRYEICTFWYYHKIKLAHIWTINLGICTQKDITLLCCKL